MKVYAVADIHGEASRLDRIEANIDRFAPDCLVVAGDIINWVKAAPVYSRLNRLPVPVLAVCGNTDPFGQEKHLRAYPNIRSLHLKRLYLGGIPICGIGGTIPVPFSSRIRLLERRLIRDARHLVDRHTLLVVHPPPYGTLDRVMGRFSAGSRAVAEIVRQCRPRVLVCGHIHEEPGSKYLHETLVVNCAMAGDSAGAVIEIGEIGHKEVYMIHENRQQ
ncbi:MAG: metallophosphoesterase family protein [Desulfobacteraceae bacterium]|nr:metallophosphoesterase family protein [Desulfobacteraceae bacterium]